jgi:hypothetical protein
MKGYYRQDGMWYPEYPDLGAKVAKLRHGTDRKAHGEAVLEAMRDKHRRLHMRPTPPMTPGWYRPPSITRLLRYESPLPMKGDPAWHKQKGNRWEARQQAVYEAMMQEKHARS